MTRGIHTPESAMGDRVTARSRSHALSQHPRTAAKVGSKGLVPPHRFPAGSPPGAPRTQEPRQSSPAGALGVVSGAPCPSCSLLPGGPLSPAPSPTHLCSFMLSITRPPQTRSLGDHLPSKGFLGLVQPGSRQSVPLPTPTQLIPINLNYLGWFPCGSPLLGASLTL